jgi:hypothetical protein
MIHSEIGFYAARSVDATAELPQPGLLFDELRIGIRRRLQQYHSGSREVILVPCHHVLLAQDRRCSDEKARLDKPARLEYMLRHREHLVAAQ